MNFRRVPSRKFWTQFQVDFVDEFKWRWDNALAGLVECPDDNDLFLWSESVGWDGPTIETALDKLAYRLRKPAAAPVKNVVKFFTGVLRNTLYDQQQEAA